MRTLAVLLFVAGLNAALLSRWAPPVLPGQKLHLAPEDAVGHIGFMALGMRRLAADVAFIRMLVYYGSPEGEKEHPYEYLAEYYSQASPEHHAYEGGGYPQLGPRSLRILELDPYFSYAPLYAAGALAFNLQRPEEALTLLDEARRFEPRNWRYSAYMAAVAFHKKGDGMKVLSELAPALADPDCPTMLRNIAAFINLRYGRKEEAARLYEEILLSRDDNYHAEARRKLKELRAVP
ncbi:MAG TPA: hypothetical protein DCM05_01955 [Elusimicrobia bacterium]|nr:hypothetical protein [Elusimicrobiota bacterium]